MRIDELRPEERIFALFKSDPKCGKSIAAHSFYYGEEEESPCQCGCCVRRNDAIYTFDLDARMESVVDYYNRFGKLPNIEFDRFRTFFDIHATLEELVRRCPFRLVIMDSLTALAAKSMQTMLETRSPTEKTKNKDRGGIVLSIIEDYGGEANAIKMALDLLLTISLKHNTSVILTAHIITPEPGAFRPMRVLLTGGKKIAGEIPIHFNEVYHFFVLTEGGIQVGVNDATRKFVAVTRSIGTDWASTALNLPDSIDFTNDLLYRKMKEAMKMERVTL